MGLGKLKAAWAGKREERRLEKGKTAEWGVDAGKAEEGRLLDWLERKWCKLNDAVNVQIVPDHVALVAAMLPSGREAFGSFPAKWRPEGLGEEALARMRAPLDALDAAGEMESSGDEGGDGEGGGAGGVGGGGGGAGGGGGGEGRTARTTMAGSFPAGTRAEYHGDAYY